MQAQSERFPHLADAAKQLRQAQFFVTQAMALLETHPEEGKKALSDAIHNMNAAEARIKAEL